MAEPAIVSPGQYCVFPQAAASGRGRQVRKTTSTIGESPEPSGVFHEVSRAERPSQQGRKTTSTIGESPEPSGVFHEVSRAGRPSQQGRKTTSTIGESPEPSGVFHEVSRAGRPSQRGRKTRVVEAWPALRPAGKLKHAPPFFMKFRGPKGPWQQARTGREACPTFR